MRTGCTRFLVFEKTRAHEPTTPGFLHLLFTLVRTLLSRGWLVFFSDLHRNRGTASFPRESKPTLVVTHHFSCITEDLKNLFLKKKAVRSFQIDLHGQTYAVPRFPCCIDGKTAEVPSPCTLTPYTNEDTLNESTTSIIHYI